MPAEGASKEKNVRASRAWLIGGILLLLVLVVGIIVVQRFQPAPEETPVVTPVQVTLLLDTHCDFCAQTNTILAKFDESNVKYESRTALAQKFHVKYVPAAIVSTKGLDQNAVVQGALQGQYIKNPLPVIDGKIAVPEKFLDGGARVVSFVDPPSSCAETPSLEVYLDYGDCAPCVDAYRVTQQLEKDYPELNVEYTPIVYLRTPDTVMQAAFASNKGAVCADELGYFKDYSECSFFNAQFYGNIDINYMKACVSDAGGKSKETQNQFVSCVADINKAAETLLAGNTEKLKAWDPSPYVAPWFVMDCKYSFTGFNSVESYLCDVHPELSGCAAFMTANESPPADGNGS